MKSGDQIARTRGSAFRRLASRVCQSSVQSACVTGFDAWDQTPKSSGDRISRYGHLDGGVGRPGGATCGGGGT